MFTEADNPWFRVKPLSALSVQCLVGGDGGSLRSTPAEGFGPRHHRWFVGSAVQRRRRPEPRCGPPNPPPSRIIRRGRRRPGGWNGGNALRRSPGQGTGLVYGSSNGFAWIRMWDYLVVNCLRGSGFKKFINRVDIFWLKHDGMHAALDGLCILDRNAYTGMWCIDSNKHANRMICILRQLFLYSE